MTIGLWYYFRVAAGACFRLTLRENISWRLESEISCHTNQDFFGFSRKQTAEKMGGNKGPHGFKNIPQLSGMWLSVSALRFWPAPYHIIHGNNVTFPVIP